MSFPTPEQLPALTAALIRLRGDTLGRIAEATGIGRITLSRMLNHGSNVRSDTLDRLCSYFGCRIEELVEHLPDPVAPA